MIVDVEFFVRSIVYVNEIRVMMGSNKQLDIVLYYSGLFRELLMNDNWVPLNRLLQNYGQGILDAVGKDVSDACRIDGELYGLPNNHDFAVGWDGYILRKDILDKYGIKKEDIIPFAGNVNPLGISPLLKKSMASHIESISEYPDRDYKELRSTLALYCNVPMEHIIVGNGATEMISLTMQLLRPKHALLLSPTYSEYTREIDLVGGHVEEYFLREDLDFKLDLNDLISKLTDDIDLLAICNPNNPTSSALNTEEITKILTHCKLHDIFVMIDET